jgi:hypothetical protein
MAGNCLSPGDPDPHLKQEPGQKRTSDGAPGSSVLHNQHAGTFGLFDDILLPFPPYQKATKGDEASLGLIQLLNRLLQLL